MERVKARTDILKSQKLAGKIVEEISDPSVRELVEDNYRIIYRIVNDQTIDILMVHHGARDLTKRIR